MNCGSLSPNTRSRSTKVTESPARRDFLPARRYPPRRARYSRTRACGSSPTSRSEITATLAAPAASTDGARSTVMPPMATIGTGSPFVPGPGRIATASHETRPTGLVAGVLGRGPEHGSDGQVGDRLAPGGGDLLARMRRESDDRGGPDDAAPRRAPDRPARRARRRRRAMRAMSARSFTMTSAPYGAADADDLVSHARRAPLGERLARTWSRRAPPSQHARASRHGPAVRGRHVRVEDCVERRESHTAALSRPSA